VIGILRRRYAYTALLALSCLPCSPPILRELGPMDTIPDLDKQELGAVARHSHLANHTTTPRQPPSILKLTGTQSGRPPAMPHKRPVSLSCADYPLPEKTAPRSIQHQSLYRL